MRACLKLLVVILLLSGSDVLLFAQDNSDVKIDIRECLNNLKSQDDHIYEGANDCLYNALPDNTDILLRELGNKDPLVRGRLAILFGKRRIKRATPAIIKLLDDKEVSVRKDAVYALSDMRDSRAIPSFLRLIKDGNYWMQTISLEAIVGSRESVSSKDFDEVKRILVANLKNPQKKFRQSAIACLEEIGDSSSIPLFEELARNDTYYYLEAQIENGKKVEKKRFPIRERAVKAIEKLKMNDAKKRRNGTPTNQ